MDWRYKFRFSLANIMLMMIPVAVACWIAVCASRGDAIDFLQSLSVAFALIFVPTAVGASIGGKKGFWKGWAYGMWSAIICVAVLALILLVIRIIEAIGS